MGKSSKTDKENQIAVWQASRLRALSDSLRKLETELADLKGQRKTIIEKIRETNVEMRTVIDEGPGLYDGTTDNGNPVNTDTGEVLT